MERYFTDTEILKIPNKAVRTRLYNLWDNNNLNIVISDGAWWTEHSNYAPVYMGDFLYAYLEKYLYKTMGLKSFAMLENDYVECHGKREDREL